MAGNDLPTAREDRSVESSIGMIHSREVSVWLSNGCPVGISSHLENFVWVHDLSACCLELIQQKVLFLAIIPETSNSRCRYLSDNRLPRKRKRCGLKGSCLGGAPKQQGISEEWSWLHGDVMCWFQDKMLILKALIAVMGKLWMRKVVAKNWHLNWLRTTNWICIHFSILRRISCDWHLLQVQDDGGGEGAFTIRFQRAESSRHKMSLIQVIVVQYR